MYRFFKIIFQDHRDEMYFLGVLCLLSAVVALPTPDQLHTNLPAPPPPPELKSEEKDPGSDEQVSVDPIPPSNLEQSVFDKSEESKKSSESADKPKAEKDEDKDKLDDVNVIQKEVKESKESKDSKDKSKESKEAKEPWDSKEFDQHQVLQVPEEFELPKESNEEKKDSKSEELKNQDEDDTPVFIKVISGHKPFWSTIFQLLNNFPKMWHRYVPGFRNLDQEDQQDQPIYIIRESEFDFS